MPVPIAAIRPKGSTQSPPFSPLNISGLLTWYDFSDASTLFTNTSRTTPVSADGDAIAGVTDKSGNSRHLSQNTLGLRPLYKLNQVNSLSSALYDGSDDVLNTTSFSFSQPNTVFMVAKFTGTLGTNSGALSDGLSARQQIWYSNNVPNSKLSIYAGSVVQGTSNMTNNATLISVIFNGASSKTWINGTADLVNVNAGANGINAGQQIGFSSTIPWKGPYCERIEYSGSLSDSDRISVQNYLNTKWACF